MYNIAQIIHKNPNHIYYFNSPTTAAGAYETKIRDTRKENTSDGKDIHKLKDCRNISKTKNFMSN